MAVGVMSWPGASSLAAQMAVAIDPHPVVVIQGSTPSGELNFVLPTGATRLANGDIVVADGRGPAIRYFDREGRPLRSVGRLGEGPGEFQRVSWLGQCGPDSLFAWDPMLERLSVLGRDGRIARQSRMPVRPSFLACSRSGVMAVLSFRVDSLPPGPPHGVRVPLTLVDARARVLRRMGQVQFLEVAWVNNAWLPRPLGRRTTLAFSGDRLLVGTADSAAVDVFGLDGRRLPTILLGLRSRRPQQRHLERAIEATSIFLATSLQRRLMRDWLLRIPMPGALPPYSAIHTDPSGALWVVTSFAGDSVTELRQFDQTGRPLGQVLIPVELTKVLEIGIDYVLGLREDADGEQAVVLFRLRRGP